MARDPLDQPRVLSVRQPWAHLIIAGIKTVENRTRRTRYRGPVLIHAAQACARMGVEEIEERWGVRLGTASAHALPRGGIVGIADLVDCVRVSNDPWFEGP